MRAFEASEARARLVGFAQELNAACRGAPLSAPCPESALVRRLLDALDALERWTAEIPPSEQQMRYGNTAFRTWHARVSSRTPTVRASRARVEPTRSKSIPPVASRAGALPIPHSPPPHPSSAFFPDPRARSLSSTPTDLVRVVLAEDAPPGAFVELAPYFRESFGDARRVDYGTGHECAFLAFLACLRAVGAVSDGDLPALALRVFPRYVALMRVLQRRYMLEPAGSHGVWGLDDYCFLPFYLGASQLIGNAHDLRPSCIHDDASVEEHGAAFMYLDAVGFVKRVKTGGHLRETSPMLNDISGVASWEKINAGLAKMWRAEVLGKFRSCSTSCSGASSR